MNVILAYVCQVGRIQAKKDEFWNAVYDLVGMLKSEEMVGTLVRKVICMKECMEVLALV